MCYIAVIYIYINIFIFQRAFLSSKKFQECDKFWIEFKGKNIQIITDHQTEWRTYLF